MNRKLTLSETHRRIFKTYEELKSILPFGFLKTRICLKPKYEIPNPPILKQIEKEKDKPLESSPTLKTQNLLYNKNIYLYSNDINDRKIISKLKELKKENKRTSVSITKRNENNIDSNTINNNFLLNNDNNDNDNNNNYEDRNLKTKYKYKTFSINNFNMKTNVCLPSITYRMKNKISRNMREKDGLSIRGIGLKSLERLNMDIKNDNELYEINKKDIVQRAMTNKKMNKYKLKINDYNTMENNDRTEANQKRLKKIGKKHDEKLNEIIGMRVIKKLKVKKIKPYV